MSKTSFKTADGKKYRIKITIPKLRWIRDELDIDLGRKEQFVELSNDIISFVNALYLLVKEQADEYGIDDIKFGESLEGETVVEAFNAFGEAYLRFCPPRQAKVLRSLIETASKAELTGAQEAEQRLNQLIASFKSGSTAVPSSELTQATTHLEN